MHVILKTCNYLKPVGNYIYIIIICILILNHVVTSRNLRKETHLLHLLKHQRKDQSKDVRPPWKMYLCPKFDLSPQIT